MNSSFDKPILFLKDTCPFCLKIFSFLFEIDVIKTIHIERFTPGDEREKAVREKLSTYINKASFPTLITEQGKVIADSDEIIAFYRDRFDVDLQGLVLYNYILNGPFKRIRELFKENKTLKAKQAE